MDEAMAMYQALVNPPAPDNVIASSNKGLPEGRWRADPIPNANGGQRDFAFPLPTPGKTTNPGFNSDYTPMMRGMNNGFNMLPYMLMKKQWRT